MENPRLTTSRKLTSGKNTVYIDDERYKLLLEEVTTAKITAKKTPRDYWLLRRYDVLTIHQNNKLIFPVKDTGSNILYYVCDNELFDILHEAHIRIGHGGRDRMMKEVWSHYKNITRKDIETYIQLCEPCQQNQKGIKKGITVKPIISSEFNSRCQVDLIDFQSQPDGENKFILVYQDHLTKFVVLRPLKSKRAEEVAYTLLDIFTLLGAPAILQSDNGRKFSNKIIENLKTYWPTLKIIHGKPKHSQSQGSVERANQDIENMLTTWMQDNDNSHWSEGIRFVQLMKNRAFHAGIKQTPYEALFGCKVKIGLSLPNHFTRSVETEEDWEKIIQDLDQIKADPKASTFKPCEQPLASAQDKKCSVCSQETSGAHTCRICECVIHTICAVVERSTDEGHGSKVLCPLCSKKSVALENRQIAKENLQQQAEKMLKTSGKKFPPVSIGTSVRVFVPEVDRGRGDARNIIGVVLDKTDDELYQIGTKNGVIKQLYSRSQFNVSPKDMLEIKDVPCTDISLRSIANLQSSGTGQGFKKCLCKKGCSSSKCLCFKNKMLCNSKCHSSLPCKNK
ncbi:KRAB-A domain-containing protein 2-like [Onthophagus taurus]|uniref:KRAB-A domain-containing protein 2-like n=1 Tax=Onthophagus taurus TaxID=166361 RepID=UPI0039BE980C